MAQQPLAPEDPSGENRPSQVQSDSSQTSPGTDTVDVPQYGLLKVLVLHLLPGALATLAYLALVPLASRVHFPTMSALLLSAAIALVPLEMGHLLLQGKRLNGCWSLAGIVLYQRKWAGWRYFLMALGLFVLSVAGYTLSEPLDRVLLAAWAVCLLRPRAVCAIQPHCVDRHVFCPAVTGWISLPHR
jgi:hypothetical protein